MDGVGNNTSSSDYFNFSNLPKTLVSTVTSLFSVTIENLLKLNNLINKLNSTQKVVVYTAGTLVIGTIIFKNIFKTKEVKTGSAEHSNNSESVEKKENNLEEAAPAISSDLRPNNHEREEYKIRLGYDRLQMLKIFNLQFDRTLASIEGNWYDKTYLEPPKLFQISSFEKIPKGTIYLSKSHAQVVRAAYSEHPEYSFFKDPLDRLITPPANSENNLFFTAYHANLVRVIFRCICLNSFNELCLESSY